MTLQWGFAGGKDEGIAVLRALISQGHKPAFIAASETLPKTDKIHLSNFANGASIPFSVSRNLQEMAPRLSELDLILTCRFELLPETVFNQPRFGCFNIHPSLLPKYRGVHPISWALINDEKEFGVSLHGIDSGIDTGPVYFQQSIAIRDTDDIWTLTNAAQLVSTELAVKLFEYLSKHDSLPQDVPQAGDPSYAPRRTPEDGLIEWPQSTRTVFNICRALRPPLPPAFWETDKGERILILECRLASTTDQDAQKKLLSQPDWSLFRCPDGQILLKTNRPLDDMDLTFPSVSLVRK